jgi:hypothetical protein
MSVDVFCKPVIFPQDGRVLFTDYTAYYLMLAAAKQTELYIHFAVNKRALSSPKCDIWGLSV